MSLSQSIRPDMRDADLKIDFINYLTEHPDERFWQALRNWSDHRFILAADASDASDVTKIHDLLEAAKAQDTFYWEGRR